MQYSKKLLLLCAAVFVITFSLFSFSLNGEFLDWDDSVNFVLNPHYRGLAWDNIKWMFSTFRMGHYQPLSWLTLGADYLLWGMKPFGYHLSSVMLHSSNAVLFFLLSLKILGMTDLDKYGKNLFFAAFFSALFFSLHPLRAESVSWITERRDVLCGFFVLSCFLAYFKHSEASGSAEKNINGRKFYFLSLFLCLCAFLSKSMAVVIPPVLLIFDCFPLKRVILPEKSAKIKDFFIKNKSIIMEKLPFFALSMIFAAVAYFGAGKAAGQPDYYAPSLAKAFYSYGFYLWKTLFPFGLVPVYPMPESWILPDLLSFMGMAALFVASWKIRRKTPIFLAAWFYYVIVLFPVCGLLDGSPQPASDRYSYLPMFSAAVVAGYAAERMASSAKKGANFARAAFMTIPFLLAGICFFQQKAWSDSETLWLHQLEYGNNCDIAWNNLSNAQRTKGNYPMALMYITKAMDLKPDYPPYMCNAAKIHLAMGNNEAALSLFESAFRLDPARIDAEYFIGQIKSGHKEH